MSDRPGGSPLFVGLMSGTSADGIDAVLVDFGSCTPTLVGCHHATYTGELRERILRIASSEIVPIEQVMTLDRDLGLLSAEAVRSLLAARAVEPARVAAIGSHGQTIRHLPGQRCTLQIGDANQIAQQTGIATVADLRRRDMAAGGQGAPLAPAFHEYAFRCEEEERVVVNIGGMANLTWLPGNPEADVLGHDTGPGNRFLDLWVHRNRSAPFDEEGRWAATGTIQLELLEHMLEDPYFHRAPPKSTGPEWFSESWLERNLKAHPNVSAEDVQATLAELTAHTIAREVQAIQPPVTAAYLCGGGAHNTYLVSRIKAQLPGVRVGTTAELGVPPQWVEATAFAWLAMQTISGQSGNLPSVTGAREHVILGAIYPAGNGLQK